MDATTGNNRATVNCDLTGVRYNCFLAEGHGVVKVCHNNSSLYTSSPRSLIQLSDVYFLFNTVQNLKREYNAHTTSYIYD